MDIKLSKVLDECISQINKGETIENCLAQYAHLREQIEPLLHTAQSISTMPKVVPSEEFRRLSRVRLVARLCQEAVQTQATESSQNVFRHLFDELAMAWHSLLHIIAPVRRIAVPVTLALLLLLVASIGAFRFLSPTPALASQCTLTIFGGNAMLQEPGANEWKQGTDGMTLVAGTRIKTSADSQALVTFFEGSTTKLEADTEIEIRQVEGDDQQATTIILKQRLGRTWSHVVKMLNQGSRYEIETPAATAIVRGTLFTTEVDETGSTTVATREGLVSVAAQGREVYVPPQQQTEVGTGTAPTQPAPSPTAEAELVIIIDQTAVGSVRDPLGSSTGNLPSGSSFNQISGSQCTSNPDGSQAITIPQPVSGEYVIALRNTNEGEAHFRIQGKAAKDAVFEYAGTLETSQGDGWLVHFNLRVDQGKLVGIEVSHVEPLKNNAPEKIIDKEPAKEKVTPAEPRWQSGERQQDKVDAQDKNEPQGKSIEPAQNSQPEQGVGPGQGNQLEQNLGQGENEQPEQNSGHDKGNQPEQNPAPGQSNQPEQNTDQDKSNQSEQNADHGKGNQPEQNADQDKSNQSEQNADHGKSNPPEQNTDHGKSNPPEQSNGKEREK